LALEDPARPVFPVFRVGGSGPGRFLGIN